MRSNQKLIKFTKKNKNESNLLQRLLKSTREDEKQPKADQIYYKGQE